MTTIATLLSGGEGVGVGARAAGLRHLWGIEIDDAIATVARDNGFPVISAAIQDVDPHALEAPDVLHASPECQNASNAKNVDGADTLEEKETRLDVEIAGCIVRYLEVLQPRVFSLENVYGYRRFQSFRMIMVALARLGYFSDVQHLNTADFGVPQTRKRLILRAVRGGLVPQLPAPEPWIGWYQAIEDLIPTLPESKFAPWQMARLPLELITEYGTCLIQRHPNARGDGIYPKERPAKTIEATGTAPRAFILSNAATEWGDGLRGGDEPVHTVTEQSNGRTRAFIVDGQNTKSVSVRNADEPSLTVTAGNKGLHRAFVVGGQFGKPADGSGEARPPQVKHEDEPIFCVTAVNKGDWRAWLSQGRVVKMTPHCLARFQSFPDSYRLPEHNGLACRVIGNAVPPLLYEKLVRGLAGE